MEIVVASGKGGTGKTFLASNLAILINERLDGAVAADADVEAPDLVLAMGGEKKLLRSREIWESMKASIDYKLCNRCLKCVDVCMFDAIRLVDGEPRIIEEFCEGCGACAHVCPANAISFRRTRTGRIYSVETVAGVKTTTGDLEIGGRNTGDLVYLVREEAKEIARGDHVKNIVIDSAPGIGCPVISSLSGADLLIIVVEPTSQSLKGAKRLLKVAESFKMKVTYVANKFDLNEDFLKTIDSELGLECVGKIPYDSEVPSSYSMMKPIAIHGMDTRAGKALKEVFENLRSWIT
ncbi:MAG TPA: 4Fe-4S dicluster domain-containing protein [Nitrososphaeria archaeon]|nr:4Fe-4S dicluster domain-containing protein [Nitrososphaeria archaeon]